MMQVTIIILCLAVYAHTAETDSISWTYNPGCEDETMCGKANMLHVQSPTHQYLWSTQNGLSGVVVSGNGTLTVNWTKYDNDEVCVDVDTPSSFGWALTSLTVANKTHHNQTIDLSGEEWDPIQIQNETSSGNNVTFGYTNKYITITMNVWNSTGRTSYNPKLQFNLNSSIFDIIVNISRIPGVDIDNPNSATLGISVASKNELSANTTRSFDDEYSPALFEYNMIQDSHWDGVYMLWRPVVYISSDRSTISQLKMGQISNQSSGTSSLLGKFYEESKIRTLDLGIYPPDGQNTISDTFYWTGVLGRGKPQEESLSTVGIVLTFLIVGVPCIAVIGGTVVIIYKKHSTVSNDGYQAI